MDRGIYTSEQNIRLWTICGPALILLCTLAASFSAPSVLVPFVLCAVLGIFLSLQWRQAGLVISLLLLFLVAAFCFYYFPNANSRIWSLYLSVSMGISLIVCRLCWDESDAILSQLSLEKKASEKQLSVIEEGHKIAEEAWIDQRNELLKKIDSLKQEYETAAESALQTHQRLLSEIEEKHERRVLELQEREDQEKELLQRTLATQKKQINEVEQARAKEREDKEQLQSALEAQKQQTLEIQRAKENADKDQEVLQSALEAQKLQILEIQRAKDNADAERKAAAEELAALALTAAAEPCIIELPQVAVDTDSQIQQSNQQNYQAMYQQLREQFDEKAKILQQTRQQLFQTNEQVLSLQKEKEELQQLGNNPYGSALERHIVRMEDTHTKQQHFLSEEIHSLYGFIEKLLIQG